MFTHTSNKEMQRCIKFVRKAKGEVEPRSFNNEAH